MENFPTKDCEDKVVIMDLQKRTINKMLEEMNDEEKVAKIYQFTFKLWKSA